MGLELSSSIEEKSDRFGYRVVFKALIVLAIVGGATPLLLFLSEWFHVTLVMFLLLAIVFFSGWFLGRVCGFSTGLLGWIAVNILSIYDLGPQIFAPYSPNRLIGLLLLISLGTMAGALHELRRRLRQKGLEQQQSQQLLYSASARLALILESLPVVSYNCQAHGDFAVTYISGNVADLTGFSAEQFTSNPSFWAERIHPDDEQRVFAELPKLFASGVHQHEYRWQAANGTYLRFFDSLRLIPSSNGQEGQIVGIWQDITLRKQAEESLQSREELYRDAIAAADAVAYQREFANDSYTHMDDGIQRLVGYGAEEVTPDIWSKIALESAMYGQAEGMTETEAELLLHRGDLKVWKADYKVRHKDGQIRWLSDSSVPILDEQGEVIGSLGILQDTTDRKRAEESLRLTQFAIDHAADAACWVDANANLLYVNNAACQSLGYSRQEMLKMSVYDIDTQIPLGSWPSVWEDMKQRGSFTMESVHRAKDGREFPVEVSINYLQHHGIEYACSFCRDISQRRQTEETLRQSEEQYRLLLENHVDGVALVDRGKIVFVNQQLCDLLAYTEQEILNQSPQIFLVEIDRQRSVQHIKTISEGGKASPTEYTFLRKDGSTVAGEIISRPILYSGRTAVLGVIRDITDRKDAEEQSRKHLAELAHVTRLATMGEMVTGLAHELNQPLTAVANSAHTCERMLLNDAEPDVEKLRGLTNRISEQAHRAGQIIRRLRDLTRKSEPTRDRVKVSDLIDDVAELMSADARRLGIRLKVQESPQVYEICVDRIQIEQVLVNLVKNAFEELAETHSQQRMVTIETSSSGGDSVQISVSDNGGEFAEIDVKQLFEPFFTTKEQGIGMGLAISRSIVESHEGKFRAIANDSDGATFFFTLPLVQP